MYALVFTDTAKRQYEGLNPKTMKELAAALEDERKSRVWKRDKRGKWIKVKRPRRAA